MNLKRLPSAKSLQCRSMVKSDSKFWLKMKGAAVSQEKDVPELTRIASQNRFKSMSAWKNYQTGVALEVIPRVILLQRDLRVSLINVHLIQPVLFKVGTNLCQPKTLSRGRWDTQSDSEDHLSSTRSWCLNNKLLKANHAHPVLVRD